MYMGYFLSNPFPFCQGRSAGPFRTYPGAPRGMFACAPLEPMGHAAAMGLGFFRPNQAVQEGYYARRTSLMQGLAGMGLHGAAGYWRARRSYLRNP